jgi:hypothetical protein
MKEKSIMKRINKPKYYVLLGGSLSLGSFVFYITKNIWFSLGAFLGLMILCGIYNFNIDAEEYKKKQEELPSKKEKSV